MWGSIITVTLLEIVIIGCVGNMRNEKFGYIWAILMEGRLVGWCLCVFTSDVKSLFVGSSRVPLRSIEALVPRYASEDFFRSIHLSKGTGCLRFSFAKMQHRYLRRCRWYSFEVAKSHPPLTLVPIRPAILPIHLPPPASRCHNRHSYRRIHLYHDFFVITTCSSTSTSTSSLSTSSNSPFLYKGILTPNLLNYTPSPAPRHRPLSQQHSPSP